MSEPEPARSYHHGDLRNALIAAAERLLAERSDWTFTLREIARAASVSHNAPYNHFSDRRALLAAVAARGFDELTAALRRGLAEAKELEVGARIRAIARAYVAFAASHGAQYRLMFSADLAGFEDSAFREAGERAFAVLRTLLAEGVADGTLRPDDDGSHALAAWSLVHGLSTLVLDGRVPLELGAAALADSVAKTLVEGLAPL